ncbi:interleukin-2 receptor subunit beta-like [Arapaima gigas]
MFQIFGFLTSINLTVMCNGSISPIVSIPEYEAWQHIKMHPPGSPKIDSSNITWSHGEPVSTFISYSFQLQYKRSNQKWEDVKLINLENMQNFLYLPEEHLEKGAEYQVRVRVRSTEEPDTEWSDWSPTVTWRSAVGTSPTHSSLQNSNLDLKFLIGVPAVLVCLFMIFILGVHRSSWAYKLKPVPDPSKFFEVLNSVHNGNFQKWLHPIFAPESFVTALQTEDISSVEVSNREDISTPLKKELHSLLEHNNSGSQCSSFSNMGYFCSKLPSSYEIETCNVYFSYHPVGDSTEGDTEAERKVDSEPLQICSAYKPLDQLGQPGHSDSLSGPRSEDQQTEDKGEVDNLPEKKLASTKLFDILPFPLPCGPLPHTLPGFPQFPFPFVGPDLATVLNGNLSQLEGTLFKPSSLSIEPCDEGYMPAKNTNNNC